MTLTLDSKDLGPEDVVAALHHVVYDSVLPCEIAHEKDRPESEIRYRLRLRDIGSVQIFTIACSPNTVTRTVRLAQEDPEPAIFLHLPNSGVSGVAQHGRELTTEAGDLAIIDSSAPYTLHFDQGMDQHYFRIPQTLLGMSRKSIRELTATSLRRQPMGRFVASYLTQLATMKNVAGPGASAQLGEATVDLVRRMLTAQSADVHDGERALEATLELRILDYIARHLPEPELSVRRIASAHEISPRRVHAVLDRAGFPSPEEWILTRRLDACRHELTTADSKNQTIATIANSWGFTDIELFDRNFRAAFGLSPREWREQTR